MGYKFEASNSKESNEALEHYFQFHDDYVAGIEIKFDDYKALNDKGESTGIRGANMAIILSVNTRPYGKDHERIVKVEFKDVRSFDISAPSGEGNWWGIMDNFTSEEGDCIKFDMEFIAGDARFAVVFSKMIITSDYVRKE